MLFQSNLYYRGRSFISEIQPSLVSATDQQPDKYYSVTCSGQLDDQPNLPGADPGLCHQDLKSPKCKLDEMDIPI